MKNMKKVYLLLAFATFLNGCAPQYIQDLSKNQYFEKQIYADQNAYYVGEWTGATGPALTSVRINGDGNIKICSSNEYFGASNGKVFIENGKTQMIFESGTQYEIISLEEDHLLVSVYDQKYKFYSGNVPERCKPIFSAFK